MQSYKFTMEDWKEQVLHFVTKWIFVFGWAVLSFVGKLSTMMLIGKKITWRQLIGSAGVTLFFGAVTVAWCDYMQLSQSLRMFLVPSVCFTSDKLAIAVFQFKVNYKTILLDLANYIKNKFH